MLSNVHVESKNKAKGKGRNQKALPARVASCIPMVFVIYGWARFMTQSPKAVNRAQNSKHLLLWHIAAAQLERGSGAA